MTDDVEVWIDSFGSAKELRDMEFTDEDWLIKDMLVPGGYMIVYGKEGAGKSRLVYQLAQSFQTGEPWFGLNIGKTGKVLYLEMDMAPMESHIMVKDAHEAGYAPSEEGIIFPKVRGSLNVLTSSGRKALEALKEAHDPLVIVIDTISDIFLDDGKSDNVNELYRRVINVFREVFPEAGLIFLLHKRKMNQYLQAKGGTDEDSALGPGEQTQKASSVIQIFKVNETQKKIIIDKARQKKPFKELVVFTSEDDRGFCRVDLSYVGDAKQALALWPNLKGLDPRAIEQVDSFAAVYRSIEDLSGRKIKADTAKKAHQRARDLNVVFHWEAKVKGTEV